ncbi:MAG: tetratricopeptide repeat protein, partial [Acidobacteria bacterium]|nr:tetratricopeptide repeat protein [Acidobacteriota bacterium]
LERSRDLPAAVGDASPLALSLNALVSVLCYKDEYGTAEAPALEALELTRTLPGGVSQRITALEHLARIRNAGGDYAEAARLNREALALHRARYGERHPAQIATLNNLGLDLRRLEELDAAQRAYEEAAELQKANFGPQSADPYLLNNLASVHLSREDYAGAEALFREGLARVREIDPEHWMIFHFGLRVGQAQTLAGRAEAAEVGLRELLAAWRLRLGDHWRIAEGESILGECLSAQGRCAEAAPLLEGSFERLASRAKDRTRRDAFDRLERHLGRCGGLEELPRFAAMLEKESSGT